MQCAVDVLYVLYGVPVSYLQFARWFGKLNREAVSDAALIYAVTADCASFLRYVGDLYAFVLASH